MLDIEYSVITSNVIKSFDCTWLIKRNPRYHDLWYEYGPKMMACVRDGAVEVFLSKTTGFSCKYNYKIPNYNYKINEDKDDLW